MSKDNLRDGRVKNWFYLENDLLDCEDLNIYEKMIYIVIARYVNKEDKAFPSVPTISKKGSMSERQVQTITNSLVKKGLIKKGHHQEVDYEACPGASHACHRLVPFWVPLCF